MKILSFNINGLRARPHQLEAIIDRIQPDIIGLQEIKVDDSQFPEEMIRNLGYHVAYHGQKSHYGVALLSRHEPVQIIKGLPGDTEDSQKRLIMGEFIYNGKPVYVFNGYFPQGENRDHPQKFPSKLAFYKTLTKHLNEAFDPAQQVVVMGDINISPTDLDIGIGDDNAKRWLRSGKCSFLPEERALLQELLDFGLTDSFRHFHPTINDRFSWFDYRSRGFEDTPKRGLRIDAILVTQALLEQTVCSEIDYLARQMEKPSDHCPIWLELRS